MSMLFFLDEFNRAPDKVLNAIMELIQFKTINGYPMKNLKVIWAAINPEDEDDTYSVNHLDPAQLDRFQIHIAVPYKADKAYFLKKYPTVGQIFLDWWKELPFEIQKKVSPRRLDYAADAFINQCRLEDVLPVDSGIAKLRDSLRSLPFQDQLKTISDVDAATAFLRNVNNATRLLDMVKRNDTASIDFFTKYGAVLPKELVEPFVEVVYAKKQGLEVIGSVEELIDKLPNDAGDQGTAVLINNVDMNLMFKNGGSLENDLKALVQTKRNIIHKLANRLIDVMMKCQEKTLIRIFWGTLGRDGGKATNFQNIAQAVGRLDEGRFITHKQRTWINNKLYSRGIVSDMHFI